MYKNSVRPLYELDAGYKLQCASIFFVFLKVKNLCNRFTLYIIVKLQVQSKNKVYIH